MMGDEGTLDGKIAALEIKLLVAQYPDENSVKSDSTLLLSKSRRKENVTRRRKKI